MTKILYFSRHKMTPEQLDDINRLFPSPQIDTLDMTVSSAEELLNYCMGYDILAAVLPLHLYVDFFKIKPDNLRVIFARSKRIPIEPTVADNRLSNNETQYLFVHDGWTEITDLECHLIRL